MVSLNWSVVIRQLIHAASIFFFWSEDGLEEDFLTLCYQWYLKLTSPCHHPRENLKEMALQDLRLPKAKEKTGLTAHQIAVLIL